MLHVSIVLARLQVLKVHLMPEDVEFNESAVSDGNVYITANYVNDPRTVQPVETGCGRDGPGIESR
jgi:hypothetical protein